MPPGAEGLFPTPGSCAGRVTEPSSSLLRKMMRRQAPVSLWDQPQPYLRNLTSFPNSSLRAQISSPHLDAQRCIPPTPAAPGICLSCLGLLESTGTPCSSPAPALLLAPCKLPRGRGEQSPRPAPASDPHPNIGPCATGARVSLQPCTGCDAFGEHTRWTDTAITPTKPKKGKVGDFSPPSLNGSIAQWAQSKQLPSAEPAFPLQEGEGVWKALSGEGSAAKQDVLMKDN